MSASSPSAPVKPAENFIPWEQIEPLLGECRTLGDLGTAILARTGFSRDRMLVRTRPAFVFEDWRDVLRDGLWLFNKATHSAPGRDVRDVVIG